MIKTMTKLNITPSKTLFYDNNTDNVFAFESDDIIKDNTEVIVYMNTNNTTTIYDDIIKDYKIIP